MNLITEMELYCSQCGETMKGVFGLQPVFDGNTSKVKAYIRVEPCEHCKKKRGE